MCLHPDHVCDRWPQCPEREDELLCDFTCPPQCLCQGLAFVCRQSFNTTEHLDLRYLDASGSNVTSSHLAPLSFLIYLKMSWCGLNTWSNPYLPNLQHLDLSPNHFNTFPILPSSVPNIRSIKLHDNPITRLFTSSHTITYSFTTLRYLDLSNTDITFLETFDLSSFPEIRILNLSQTELVEIGGAGFSHLSNLQNLDLRSSKLLSFPRRIVKDLKELKYVQADSYKLCCKETLPEGFNIDNCHAPQDEVSSCEDLLRSPFYRVCLWAICFMSVLGNCGSLVFKMLTQRGDLLRLGYNVFVSSLCLSDLCMGFYLVFIGASDMYNRGMTRILFLAFKNLMHSFATLIYESKCTSTCSI